MLFTEFRFVLFFIIVFILYWAIKTIRAKIALLTLASFVFYGAWDWRFLGLILFVISVTYYAQKFLFVTQSDTQKGRITTSAVVLLLTTLGIFKYFNFFADSFITLLQSAGMNASQPLIAIILPVGISFYIFQAIGLIVDIRRGVFEKPQSFLDVCFFVAFFPQLVAGPIMRAKDFFPQIEIKHKLKDIPWSGIFILFLGGFFKKAVIADNLAILFVDPVFSEPGLYSNGAIILGIFAYAAQIYCDFSGYSDMAIAISRCFGFQLPKNFESPYFSHTITEFWRRWHISLSHWLRDYLYISLGGNRVSEIKNYRNLMATMVLGGLWHGASWNFLIWGYLHGTALSLERLWQWPERIKKHWILRLFSLGITFYMVCIAWVFFRSPDLDVSLYMISSMFGLANVGIETFSSLSWALMISLAALHFAISRFHIGQKLAMLPAPIVAAICGLWLAAMLPFIPSQSQPFIYFQF